MKKFINKTLIMFSFTLLLISCSVENEKLFDESATERIENNKQKVKSKLISSDNGWVFDYYPDQTQSFGGYSLIVKFNEDDVDVYSELAADIAVPANSLYDVITRGGATLTFNEFNSMVHLFSNPSSANYQGFRGDYEFLMSIVSDSKLKARGSFTGNDLFLIKNEVSPEEYLTKVREVSSILDESSFYLIEDISKFTFLPKSSRNLTIPVNSVKNSETIQIAFAYTDKGIRFYEPINMNGVNVSELLLNDTKDKLVNIDANVIIELVRPPINVNQDWFFDATVDLSPLMVNTFSAITTANTARWGEVLSPIVRFGNTTVNGTTSPGIMFRSDSFLAQHLLNFSGVPGENDKISISKGAGAFNWRFYTHLLPVVDIITDNSPFKIEPTPVLDPTEVKLTSISNPDVWFIIKR